MFGKSLDHVIKVEAEFLRFNNQRLKIFLQQIAALGSRRRHACSYDRAKTRVNIKQPLRDELADDFVRRVGVDFQLFAEFADGRKRITSAHLTSDDCFLGGVDDLFANRSARLECDVERNHRVYYNR